MEHFKQLEEALRGWSSCTKQIRRALLPESAVEHSQKVLEADSRLRSWRANPKSEWGLLYHSSQAFVDFNNPAGKHPCMCSCFNTQVQKHTLWVRKKRAAFQQSYWEPPKAATRRVVGAVRLGEVLWLLLFCCLSALAGQNLAFEVLSAHPYPGCKVSSSRTPHIACHSPQEA